LLHRHAQTGIHAIFRLEENSYNEIKTFFASPETDTQITLLPSPQRQAEIRSEFPDLHFVPLKLRLLKYKIADTLFCLGSTLLDDVGYPLQAFIDVYHGRWSIEELYKVSKRIFIIEDFHGRTERGVKQELFAHFVLITLNRLFANRADIELNPGPASTSQPLEHASPVRRTNFKNCIHVLDRALEEILLLQHRITSVVQRLFGTILGRHQRVRPNRSFLRRSMRPESKWRSSNQNKQPQKVQQPAGAHA
jgi:hypothetical protein